MLPNTEDRAAAFHQARLDLKSLLAASNLTQKDLADHVGLSPSNFSQRIGLDRVAIFELVADRFPPAGWVAARLYVKLARVYLARWEALAQGPEEELRRTLLEMEKMIEAVRRR